MIFLYYSDDPEDAFDMLKNLRKKKPEKQWDMAEVLHMTNPPRTKKKFCVFQKETDDN